MKASHSDVFWRMKNFVWHWKQSEIKCYMVDVDAHSLRSNSVSQRKIAESVFSKQPRWSTKRKGIFCSKKNSFRFNKSKHNGLCHLNWIKSSMSKRVFKELTIFKYFPASPKHGQGNQENHSFCVSEIWCLLIVKMSEVKMVNHPLHPGPYLQLIVINSTPY